jgi:streptogramin lyase
MTQIGIRSRRLIAALLVCTLPALSGVGDWKSYTAKREVRDLTLGGAGDSLLWAATSGGMFSSTPHLHEYHEYTTSEGLKTIDLTAIASDASGNIWIGAQNGFLQMYNPAANQWRYFSDIAVRTDPNKRINALDVVGDTLYILSDIGVSLFSISRSEFGDTYTRFGAQPNQVVGSATCLKILGGNLWVGTRNGVASTSVSNPNPSAPESWQLYTTAQGLSSSLVTRLSSIDTVLLASTSNGLNAFGGGSWNLVPGTAGLNLLGVTDEFTQFAYPYNCPGYVAFVTNHDVWLYDGITPSKIDSLNSYTLTTISHDGLLGTQNSGALSYVYCTRIYPPGINPAISDIYFPPGPPSNKFVGLAVDNRGVVWSGTGISNGEGFMSFDGTSWRSYTPATDSRLANGNFYRVNIGNNNAKWVSAWGDGVALLDDAGTIQKVFNATNGLSPSIDPLFVVVGGVATDQNGTAWIANRTPRGDTTLVTLAPDSSIGYTLGISTRTPPVTVLADVVIDQFGTKWFTNFSRFEGVLPYALWFYNEHYALPNTSGGWGKMTTADGLSTNKVYSIAAGRDGEMWIGSDQGVSIIFDPSNPYDVAQYHPQQVADQIIQCIVVDPLNNKWLGTRQGVFVLSPDGTTLLNRYTVQNTEGKLLDDDVASMAIDGRTGIVYMGTEKGLSTLRTPALEPQRSFGDLVFYPNPMIIPSQSDLTIDGLIENSLIKIITVQGSLVAEFRSPGGRVAYWDGRMTNGEYAGTGIYLVVAYSEDGTKVAKGKVAVIRK